MRADIEAGAVLPDYELTDHTGKRRKLSDLQGPDPMILVLSRGAYCPKDRRQAEGSGSTSPRDGSRLRPPCHDQYRQFDCYE